jgi:glucose-1-phosphate thymidylyltransferase
MKGIILAGGKGSRLFPLTKVTNKHLLPIYNQPMIYYPINTLRNSGIKDVLIVSGRHHAGHFLELLGRGEEMGMHFSYTIQEKEGGIAQALFLAKDFSDNDNIAVILGDNVFLDNFKEEVQSFESGAKVFLKGVEEPERFGVAEIKENKVINIEEKPKNPKSNYATTGFYLYDLKVFDIIETLKPSNRNELEITDVNNFYIKEGKLEAAFVNKFWSDAGTFDSLYSVSKFIKEGD